MRNGSKLPHIVGRSVILCQALIMIKTLVSSSGEQLMGRDINKEGKEMAQLSLVTQTYDAY